MIVGGINDVTEVFQFIETNSTTNYGELPKRRYDAVGATLGDVPILCGGNYPSYYGALNDCITFENSKWDTSHLLTEHRVSSAGVQINYTSFWILGGGIKLPYYLNSTEFIIQGKTNGIPGPKLPYNMSKMCAAKLSEKEIFVIGGVNSEHGISTDVWIYNPQKDFEKKKGPSLNDRRQQHSCSILRDGEKTQIIVAGGEGRKGMDLGPLNSVEIYDPIDNAWHYGNCF